MMKATLAPVALIAGLLLGLPTTVPAEVVNLDFGSPGDAVHTGSDGALSTDGTVWNGVPYNGNVSDLVDEHGTATALGVTILTAPTAPGPFMNLGVFNNLQDTGMLGSGFEIRNLVPDSLYTLAVYGGMNTTFSVSGSAAAPCTGSPTYSLPGSAGQDYCLRVDLLPIELEPGVFGIRVENLSGPVLGAQFLGAVSPGETPPDDPPGGDEPPAGGEVPTCATIGAFFNEAVAAGTLTGSGPGRSAGGRLRAMENMMAEACANIEAGNLDAACALLDAALQKCDGSDPDFVVGEALAELESQTVAMRMDLCGDPGRINVRTSPESEATPLSIPATWGLLKALYDTNP